VIYFLPIYIVIWAITIYLDIEALRQGKGGCMNAEQLRTLADFAKWTPTDPSPIRRNAKIRILDQLQEILKGRR
jgi:hypothetical protein